LRALIKVLGRLIERAWEPIGNAILVKYPINFYAIYIKKAKDVSCPRP
jgi:hypothetical protein